MAWAAESILRELEAGNEAVSLGPAERFQPNPYEPPFVKRPTTPESGVCAFCSAFSVPA